MPGSDKKDQKGSKKVRKKHSGKSMSGTTSNASSTLEKKQQKMRSLGSKTSSPVKEKSKKSTATKPNKQAESEGKQVEVIASKSDEKPKQDATSAKVIVSKSDEKPKQDATSAKDHRIVSEPNSINLCVVVHGGSAVIQLCRLLRELKSKIPSLHIKIVYTKSALDMLNGELERTRISQLLELSDTLHYPDTCYAEFSKDDRGRIDYKRVAAECFASSAHLVAALPMTMTGLESLSRARNDSLALMVENLSDDQAKINACMVRLRGFEVHESTSTGQLNPECVEILEERCKRWMAKCRKFRFIIRLALELLGEMRPQQKGFTQDEICDEILQSGLFVPKARRDLVEHHFARAIEQEVEIGSIRLNEAGFYSLPEWLNDNGGDEEEGDGDDDDDDGDGGPTIEDAKDVTR